MPNTPVIAANVTITSKSINNDSVASVFPNVIGMNFDFWDGTVSIADANFGSFSFGLSLVTAITYTVAGTTYTVVIV